MRGGEREEGGGRGRKRGERVVQWGREEGVRGGEREEGGGRRREKGERVVH